MPMVPTPNPLLLRAVGTGFHLLADDDPRGLVWHGIPASQGGPGMILVEAADGPTAALIAELLIRRVIPLLHQGDLIAAGRAFAVIIAEQPAAHLAITVLATDGRMGMVLTCGGHRVVNHRQGRGRVLQGVGIRPCIAQVRWQPGVHLVSVALATDQALPLGKIGRVVGLTASPQELCHLLVEEAGDHDPDLHHAAIALIHPPGAEPT